jgi:hypothetical protein
MYPDGNDSSGDFVPRMGEQMYKSTQDVRVICRAEKYIKPHPSDAQSLCSLWDILLFRENDEAVKISRLWRRGHKRTADDDPLGTFRDRELTNVADGRTEGLTFFA